MQKLTKKDRKRFEEVCRKIREALHLDHWEHEYTIEAKADKEGSRKYASSMCFVEGRRLWIAIYPYFWEKDKKTQITTLIHEHVHVVMQTQDQIIHKIIDWSHEADRRWSEMTYTKANEHVVDHLASVFYDLLKDRL